MYTGPTDSTAAVDATRNQLVTSWHADVLLTGAGILLGFLMISMRRGGTAR